MATVPTFVDGTVAHQADLAFALNPPALFTYQNVQQALLVSATSTLITFDTNVYDTDSAGATHSTTTNTSRIQPLTAGSHLITATLSFAINAAAAGNRALDLRKNAAGVSTGGTRVGFDARNAVVSTVLPSTCTITQVVQFNGTTDYLEMFGLQSQGTTLGLFSANQAASWIGSVGIVTRWQNS